jgi:adenylate cyclase
MADEGFKRKLTAILSADVEGYSRLMDQDEEATIRALTAYRSAITDIVQHYRGRVVDTPGDNILAEFTSVIDAVNCSVKIQQELAERNTELPHERRMEFRIGVNVGDVVEEEDRIYGDGVNMAARVEGMAEAGGICITGRAYDQIKNKLELGYKYLGEHSVKNIAEPVRAYKVLMEPDAAGKVIGEKRFLGRISRRAAVAVIIILIIVAGGLVGWNIYLQQSKTVEPASVEKMAFPLPDKPSIVVIPFDNLSKEPDQDYLVDGITDQIILGLSKIPDMFVIAKESSFSYKGKSVEVRQISEELGVQYVLEGSVQKAGDRVRITAQLIDAQTGRHLWAERYDRDLKDIFALQDEITLQLLTALQVKLTKGDQARYAAKGTKNLEAYLKYMKGWEHLARGSHDDYILARQMCEEAIALDPEYPAPYVILGWTHLLDAMLGTSKSPQESMGQAFELGQKALAMDDSDYYAYGLLGNIYLINREHEKAIAALERAVTLNPNYDQGFMFLGWTLAYAGRPQEGVPLLKKAMRLNPLSQKYASMVLFRLGVTYGMMGRYEEAVSELKKALDIRPDFWAIHLQLANNYINLGREEEARAHAAEVLRIVPKFSLKVFAKRVPHKDQAYREQVIDNLRKAGLK